MKMYNLITGISFCNLSVTNVTVKNGNVTIVSVNFDLVNVIFYILPATAGRDIIKNNLEDYDTSFGGWSSLLRKTAEK